MKLFRSSGKLYLLEDAEGVPIQEEFAFPVDVDVHYELRPSPQQPVKAVVYGFELPGFGQTKERLILDNGVVLTGRTFGGSVKKSMMFDIEEDIIHLHPTMAQPPTEGEPEIDSVVFGVVSSNPLGRGLCSNGVARPGQPFSFRSSFQEALQDHPSVAWSAHALRLRFKELEITLVQTSDYWKRLVDRTTLDHDSVVGMRKQDGSVLEWEKVNQVTLLFSLFLGWVNHCVSPISHIKAYRKRRLVYKGYALNLHPTVQRDRFSWLPSQDWNDDNVKPRRIDMARWVEDLFVKFSMTWEKSRRDDDGFHLALQFLRSQEKGSPGSRASILYLRDVFSACGILLRILGVSAGSRSDTIAKCLRAIGVENKLPSEGWRQHIVKQHPSLWWGVMKQQILDKEKEKETLDRPLANAENWMLHLEDPDNLKRLLSLPRPVQHYLVEVAMWIADLMVLRVVGYEGFYLNRLSQKTEIVPWSDHSRLG